MAITVAPANGKKIHSINNKNGGYLDNQREVASCGFPFLNFLIRSLNPSLNYFTAFVHEVAKDRLGLGVIHIV